MDALAGQGVRFVEAHSPSAVCTPTRYGVLTGRYCWRTWLTRGVVGGYTPPLIEPDRLTLPAMLRKRGYTTACIGKWHLGLGWTRKNGFVATAKDGPKMFRGSWQDGDPDQGLNVDFAKPVHGGPADLGFDYAYFTAACSTIDGPFCYIENRRTVGIPNRAIEVDRKKRADFRPRPGWVAPGFDLETVDPTFTRKAVEFITRSVSERPSRPFFLYLALSAPHAPWLPPKLAQGKSQAGPRGDQVYLVDWCVGRIVRALDRLKLADDTLLIVTSDNGPRHGVNGHRSAGKLRGYKSHIWEGGHREPFLVRWPGRIEPGTVSHEPIELTDMLATFAAVVGHKLPADAGEDSYNVLPALLGTNAKPIRQALVHHSCFGAFSIRKGKWKLVLGTKGSGGWVRPGDKPPDEARPGQLYDISADPYEKKDLWDERPEIVRRLEALLDRYRSKGRSAPLR
jgi:arylsulfatase A